MTRWWGWLRTKAMLRLALSLGYRWFWIPGAGDDRATVILMATTREEYTRVYAISHPTPNWKLLLENLIEHMCDEECADHGCRYRREATAALSGMPLPAPPLSEKKA